MTRGRSPNGDLTAKPNLWNAGLVEVELPSGLSVRGVLPTLAELIRLGLVPDRLRTAALHFADAKWIAGTGAERKEATKRQRDVQALVRMLIARFPQEVRVADGPWQRDDTPLEQRIAFMPTADKPGSMNLLDYDLLEDVVLRLRTPEEVTELSRRFRARTADGEEAEPAETADETFREERRGAAGGDDGTPLAVTPIRAARRSRRRPSVPPGRSADAA